MKKLVIAVASSVALFAATAGAQTTTNTVDTNAPWYQTLYNFLADSGITSATNYSLEPYGTYAPNAPKKWGGGMLAVYNVNNYAGVGVGFDYLGQFSLVSANLKFQVPTTPFAFLGGIGTNIYVTPFVLGGVGAPMSGTSQSGTGAIAIADAGGAVQFGHLWGGQFNTGVAYGTWSGAGPYSGPRYHLFMGWSKGF